MSAFILQFMHSYIMLAYIHPNIHSCMSANIQAYMHKDYVCLPTYIHENTYIQAYVHKNIIIHVSQHTYIYRYMYTCIQAHTCDTYILMDVYMHTYLNADTYMCTYTHIDYTCLPTYIPHTYMHADINTFIHTCL